MKWIYDYFFRSKPKKIPGCIPDEEVDLLMIRAGLIVIEKYPGHYWEEMFIDPWREIDLHNDIINEFVAINPYESLSMKNLMQATKLCKKWTKEINNGKYEI